MAFLESEVTWWEGNWVRSQIKGVRWPHYAASQVEWVDPRRVFSKWGMPSPAAGWNSWAVTAADCATDPWRERQSALHCPVQSTSILSLLLDQDTDENCLPSPDCSTFSKTLTPPCHSADSCVCCQWARSWYHHPHHHPCISSSWYFPVTAPWCTSPSSFCFIAFVLSFPSDWFPCFLSQSLLHKNLLVYMKCV